jgi:glycosyltransferase involved in cell wall biosynthesis
MSDTLMRVNQKKQLGGTTTAVADFWFGPRTDRSKMRQVLGLASNTVAMVTVAGLERCEGHDEILLALSCLPPLVRHRLKWFIIGPKVEADYVQKLTGDIAASDCDASLIGPLTPAKIRDIYCACDLFCRAGPRYPSQSIEPAGLVYLEAAACGLPSIAVAAGASADTVIDNETGLVVEPSVEAIAAAIAEMTLDGIKRMSLGKRAWSRVRAINWGASAVATRLVSTHGRPLGRNLKSERFAQGGGP